MTTIPASERSDCREALLQGEVCEGYEMAQNVGVAPLAKAQFLGYNCVVCCFIEEVRFV
jgi:hypothetical protein